MATGGTNTTMSASTSGAASASCTAAAKDSGLALAPTSTGSFATSRPWLRAASAASTPMAVELPTTATRGPAGSGW